MPVQYPKAGTTNSAARVGVVSADGGPTRGSPSRAIRATTTSRAWTGRPSSDEIVLQHLNRLQNTLDVMLGDVRTGAARSRFSPSATARGSTSANDLRWLDGGRVVHLGERARRLAPPLRRSRDGNDAARHARRVRHPQSGEPVRRAEVLGVDERAGSSTSRRRRTIRRSSISMRARLDGTGAMRSGSRRRRQSGTHGYDISPSGRWALHTCVVVRRAAVDGLVRLPSHEVVRTLVDNAALRARARRASRAGRSEFFRVDGGRRLSARRLDDQAARLRFDEARIPCSSTSTASRPTRPCATRGAAAVSLAPDARAAGLHRRQHRQPRHRRRRAARSWRKRIYGAVGVLASRDQAAAARAARAPARTWTRRASACGAGAAAAR